MNELMEGVKVLSENVITYSGFSIGILFLALTIIATVLSIAAFKYKSGFILIAFSIGFGLLSWIGITSNPITKTQYKVTISDTVNFKEFTQKYDVISVDGEIYTVVEKKVEEE